MSLTPFEQNIGDVGISTQEDADGQNLLFELKYISAASRNSGKSSRGDSCQYSNTSFLWDPPNYRLDLVQYISRNTHALSIDY